MTQTQESSEGAGELAVATVPTPDGPFTVIAGSHVLAQALAALEAYYDGDLEAPSRVPVLQRSGPFRERAWEVLRGVGPGRVVTYADYAALCGSPRAVRAAAGACAFNAAALFIPCHCAARSDGSLGASATGWPSRRLRPERMTACPHCWGAPLCHLLLI